MPVDLHGTLVIGISSRALFSLEAEEKIFRDDGLVRYKEYQLAHETDVLKPGVGFPLVKGILGLNAKIESKRTTEVILMSKNDSESSLRIWNSITSYGLDITRGAFTGGAPVAQYLGAYSVDLFLSFDAVDVQSAVDAGIAAALLFHHPDNLSEEVDQIRIAFDGDAVLLSDESERIYKEQGLEAFLRHEKENARKPLPDGPFAKLLKMLHFVQTKCGINNAVMRTALITSRNAPSHERVIRTLREWGVSVNETFFMGGVPKHEILCAFKPHIYFDDQMLHLEDSANTVPTGRVPYRTRPGQS